MANRKKKGEDTIRAYRSTIVLSVLLLVLSCCSLFVGVIDLTPGELLAGNFEQLEIFLISRLPRLLAILCTGIGMSVAGLIMQQLCSNKFVSPTTGATISSAQFGILLALLAAAALAGTVLLCRVRVLSGFKHASPEQRARLLAWWGQRILAARGRAAPCLPVPPPRAKQG